jgi:hypothetical protein
MKQLVEAMRNKTGGPGLDFHQSQWSSGLIARTASSKPSGGMDAYVVEKK